MRTLILMPILCYSTVSMAIEGKFSPFSCDYIKPSYQNEWVMDGYGLSTEFSSIGWNQAGGIDQSAWRGEESGEFGICSEIVTTRISTSLNIYFVEGKGLDFTPSRCAFSGEEVKYTNHIVDIESYDSHTYAISRQILNGEPIDFLHIAGVRSSDVDVRGLCEEAFKQIDGRLADKNYRSIRFTRKPKKTPGFNRFTVN